MNAEKLHELRVDMMNCEQTQNLSVLSHGYSVNQYFHELYDLVHGNKCNPQFQWRLPDWADDSDLWNNLPDMEIIDNYQIYHDCGKPYCVYTDEEGKRHFPNHAQVSAHVWEDLGGHPLEVHFMKQDMDAHLMKAKDIDDFMNLDHWQVLLLTALCEIHSNASMFGGIESTSFKMKWKQINKRGNAIIKLLEKQNENI